MIAIVQFLARQCLAFRDENDKLYQPNNGNFLKTVKMLKFEPIISEHVKNIKMSQELKKHMPYYIGKIFQNKIISALASAIKTKIKQLARQAKYLSVILDCTPDVILNKYPLL